MKKFDWDKFKTEKIAVHCKTEEEAKDFCEKMHEQGMKWMNGNSYIEEQYYDIYQEKMCYYANGEYSRLKFAEEHSLTILEWSDYMQKEFTKADLKDGMVVEYRSGKIGFCINGKILYENGFDVICDLTEDLLDEDHYKKYDIIKAYKLNMSGVHELKSVLEKKNLILIWERTEAKHMTAQEMRQKLEELTGEKIEVEPSREEMIGVCYKYCSGNDICDWCCIKKECKKNEKHDFVYYSTESLKECYEKVIANGK